MGREWRLEVGFLTDVGRHRERNEDAFSLYLPYAGEENETPFDAVFAVADGMGGHEGGEIAGRFAAQAVEQALSTRGAPAPENVNEWIRAFLGRVNEELCELSATREVARGMGSTLTLLVVRDGQAHLGHVGDSRCYRFKDGTLEQLTRDHSWVAEQLRAGLLTPEEARDHPKRNLLTQCLGVEGDLDVFVADRPLEDGCRYLLCSDGLHGMVPDHVLSRTLGEESDPQAAAARLVRLALEAGGHDNITVIVADARRVSELGRTIPGAGGPGAARSLGDTDPRLGRARPGPRPLHRMLMAGGAALLVLAAALGGWRALGSDGPTAATDSAPIETSVPDLGEATPQPADRPLETPPADSAPVDSAPVVGPVDSTRSTRGAPPAGLGAAGRTE